MTYTTLTEVPTPALEYALDILERLRDRGDFRNMEAYNFFYESGIPALGDDDSPTDYAAEVMAVSEELMGRADR